jgi:hypothetical protein
MKHNNKRVWPKERKYMIRRNKKVKKKGSKKHEEKMKEGYRVKTEKAKKVWNKKGRMH